MNFKNIQIKGASVKLWSVLVFFARHVILSCLIVSLISLSAGFFIFYSDIILADKESNNNMDSSLDIRKDYYDKIKNSWDSESRKNQGIGSKSYLNIFYTPVLPSPENPPQ